MMNLKRFFILIIAAFCAVSMVMGQSKDSEMSIEESYLQEAIELMIIRETSRSSNREQKMIALEYIAGALERGSTNEELRATLEYLSLDGTVNRTYEGRRQVNDYPDVRRQAARYLGTMGTKEAKDALVVVCRSDNEPMVLQEAIRSLGIICLNDNDDAINAVADVARKNNASKAPSDLVALVALDTFDKLAEKYKTMNSTAIEAIMRISDGPFARPVKEKAKQLLADLPKYR